ncbi:MAG: hypothetical protein ACI9KE_004120 [Polyangiales bacterium]|jgi:hypothetical protein
MRAVLVVIFLVACGKHPGSYDNSAAAAAEGAKAAASTDAATAADQAWSERFDEQRLKDALDAYEAIAAADSTNRQALERLTRGWYFWGDAFSDDKDTKVERWGTAIEWGTRCLSLNEQFAQAIADGKKEKEAVEFATRADVPCLYWTATALGKWGKAQSLSKTLRHLPTVKAYVSTTEQLDPAYFNYGPARYWGAYYSALPSFAGRDFDKSTEYFAASIEGAPYYLATRVLRAEMLAVGTANVSLFDADLAHVLAADANAKPDAGVTAENMKEQEKAKSLIARRSELFDKKALESSGD